MHRHTWTCLVFGRCSRVRSVGETILLSEFGEGSAQQISTSSAFAVCRLFASAASAADVFLPVAVKAGEEKRDQLIVLVAKRGGDVLIVHRTGQKTHGVNADRFLVWSRGRGGEGGGGEGGGEGKGRKAI